MKTYTTKLAIGDTAWFMQDNKAVSMTVESIEIHEVLDNQSGRCNQSIQYGFRKYTESGRFDKWIELYEYQIFATKEELLASL